MADFRVIWEIDVVAHGPRDAAHEARRLQRKQGSSACVFDVTGADGEMVRIDLMGDEEPEESKVTLPEENPVQITPSKFDTLQVSDCVIFTKTPPGSWTSIGDVYEVEWKSARKAYFRNTKTGGGTYDDAWAINKADFTIIREGK